MTGDKRTVRLGDVSMDEDDFFDRIVADSPPFSPEQERALRALLAPTVSDAPPARRSARRDSSERAA